jgi:calcium-dependent protein kinase
MRATRLRKSERIHDRYEIGDELLGQGTFGVVFSATSSVTSEEVAIKVIPTEDMDADKFNFLFNEVENCLHLDHPNICRVFEVYEDEQSLQIVMEKCTGDDLFTHLTSHQRYNEGDAARAMKQMMEAINYCHTHRLCHRDLKLDNWVYKEETPGALLKLIDFGFSRVIDGERMTAQLGSCYYVAPEILNAPEYDWRCDLWSLGVVAYMLLTGSPPFWGTTNSEVFQKVKQYTPDLADDFWLKTSPLAKDFVLKLLQKNPCDRPSAQEMVKHPWLPHDMHEGNVCATHIDRQVLVNMSDFAHYTAVKRTALALIAAHYSHAEVSQLKEQFRQLDFKMNGTIRIDEMTAVLGRELGMQEKEATQIFERIDCFGEDEISYTEFLAAAVQAKDLLQERYMQEAFSWFDRDGDGFISLEDMRTVYGENVEGSPTSDVLRVLDYKGQGKVDIEEWRAYLTQDCQKGEATDSEGSTKPSSVASPRSQSGARFCADFDSISEDDVAVFLPALTVNNADISRRAEQPSLSL